MFTTGLLVYDRDCTRWADIEHVRFPQIELSSKPFVKMMLINVLLRGVTLVGIVICGDNDAENILSKNSPL